MRVYLIGTDIQTATEGGVFIAQYPQGSMFMIPLYDSNTVMIGIQLILNTNVIVLNIQNYNNTDPNNRVSNQAGVPFTTAKDAYDYLIFVLGFELGLVDSVNGAIGNVIVNLDSVLGQATGFGDGNYGININTGIASLTALNFQNPVVRTVINNDNVLLTDGTVLANTISNQITLTLPTAASAFSAGRGLVYNLKKIDTSANKLIVEGNGSETIDGELNVSLFAFESITIQSNGTNWLIL